MKQRILAVTLSLSMLFSSQAFAMGVSGQASDLRQPQEISTAAKQDEANLTDTAQVQEAESMEVETPAVPDFIEENSSTADSDNETPTVPFFPEESSTDPSSSEEPSVPGSSEETPVNPSSSEETPANPSSSEETPADPGSSEETPAMTTLPALSNLKAASASYNSARISWTKLDNADGYIVYRKVDGKWKRLSVITDSSYTDKNLVCGQSYTYTVRAYKKADGKEIKGDYKKKGVTVKIIPAQAKLIEARANGSNIQITWSKVSGATGYRVYRLNGETGKWQRIYTADKNTVSYTDSKLSAGYYTYTVRAYRTVSGETVLSNYDKNGISASILPSTPKLVSASGSAKSVTVQWNTVAGADGYRVYRKTGTSGSWERLKDISDGKAKSYIDKTAAEGTYIYTVRAYIKSNGKTVWSSYVKKGVSITIPAEPSLISASGATKDITVRWGEVSGANGYRVYRKTGTSGSWERLKDISGGSKTSYTDKTAAEGNTYIYTVRAYIKADGKTVWSSYLKKGISVTIPKAPRLTSATASKSGITVKWEAVDQADGYRIYRKAGSSGWKLLTTQASDKLSVVDKDAASGEIYTYTVRAYTKSGSKQVLSTYDKKGVKAVGYMNAPEEMILAADFCYKDDPNLSDLYLLWTKVENADGYIIYYKEADSTSSWTRLEKLTADDAELDDETCCIFIEEFDMRDEYLFTIRPYKMMDGKEVKGAYDKKGVNSKDAVNFDDIFEEE